MKSVSQKTVRSVKRGGVTQQSRGVASTGKKSFNNLVGSGKKSMASKGKYSNKSY